MIFNVCLSILWTLCIIGLKSNLVDAMLVESDESSHNPVDNNMVKFNNRNTRTKC